MFEWHKKERPFLGIAGFGGGVSSKLVRGRGRFSITGGNVNALEPGNGWTYHTFTSPGNLTVSGIFTIEVLVVGGGGGGGADVGGGGGAGGVAHNSSIIIGPGTYPVTVGSAGTGGIGPNPSSVCGTSGRTGFNGGPSTFNGITALGGGGAGGWSGCPGAPGGSGGGATSNVSGNPNGTASQPSQPQPAGTTNYGNPGGNSANNTPNGNEYSGASGGGGAGAAGSNGSPSSVGGGGIGRQYPAFTGPLIGVPSLAPLSGYFAGGGAGTSDNSNYTASGGAGGGGPSNTPGTANSGGGGGGGGLPNPGGNGGSGIVIVRYPSTGAPPTHYRYWRLYKTNGAAGGPWHTEIQWTEFGQSSYYQGTNYQNWSHSGLISFIASRVTNGNTSENAFHTDTSGVGSYALLDLGAGNEKYFNKVEIWLSATGVNATWNIEASNDGSNWTTLYAGLNVNPYTNVSVNW